MKGIINRGKVLLCLIFAFIVLSVLWGSYVNTGSNLANIPGSPSYCFWTWCAQNFQWIALICLLIICAIIMVIERQNKRGWAISNRSSPSTLPFIYYMRHGSPRYFSRDHVLKSFTDKGTIAKVPLLTTPGAFPMWKQPVGSIDEPVMRAAKGLLSHLQPP